MQFLPLNRTSHSAISSNYYHSSVAIEKADINSPTLETEHCILINVQKYHFDTDCTGNVMYCHRCTIHAIHNLFNAGFLSLRSGESANAHAK